MFFILPNRSKSFENLVSISKFFPFFRLYIPRRFCFHWKYFSFLKLYGCVMQKNLLNPIKYSKNKLKPTHKHNSKICFRFLFKQRNKNQPFKLAKLLQEKISRYEYVELKGWSDLMRRRRKKISSLPWFNRPWHLLLFFGKNIEKLRRRL